VVRIPRSWAQPHMVKYRRHWRFYTRSSVGKRPLDVPELRAAFALSEGQVERIRTFRTERLGKIIAGETPEPMAGTGRIVLHIVPFGASDPRQTIDLTMLGKRFWDYPPIGCDRPGGRRFNFDGIVIHDNPAGSRPCRAYTQIFRDGILEAVESRLLTDMEEMEPRYRKLIPSVAFEADLVTALPNLFSLQRFFGIEPPVFVLLSLLGVKDWRWRPM
jgi:hypothetical protein